MRVAIFGLGYVGSVTAACLAQAGHQIIGVEIDANKRSLIQRGRPPVVEKELNWLFSENVACGRLRVTAEGAEAARSSDVSLISVGTPSQRSGGVDLDHVKRVCSEIGASLRQSSDYHVVAVRSTVLPGTVRQVLKPILETASGKEAGKHFGLCSNPEFLREGTAVADFHCPPRTLVGAYDEQCGRIVGDLYAHVDGPLFMTEIEIAEMVKYVDNAWHALKIGFANEIGQFAKEHKIDSHTVMDMFRQDKKLNISGTYLTPGFAFGGSCLPKDLRALLSAAKETDLELPILKSILESNRLHMDRALDLIYSLGSKRIGLLGVSFKEGTDDLRESPLVAIAENLIGKGFDLRICDPGVNLALILGTNRTYIDNRLPHLASLMVSSVDEVLDHADLIIVGHNTAEFRQALLRVSRKQIIIDFVRATDNASCVGEYHGLCW